MCHFLFVYLVSSTFFSMLSQSVGDTDMHTLIDVLLADVLIDKNLQQNVQNFFDTLYCGEQFTFYMVNLTVLSCLFCTLIG
jgi:hypothetical protein